MALINKNNNYIKVIKDGYFYIYVSEEARLREKNATSSSIIISEYEARIKALADDVERQYYDEEAWGREYDALVSEFARYQYDLDCYRYSPDNTYPIMAETYPTIADSIPEIIQSGSVMIESPTTAEEYEIVKERELFGYTEDA